MFVVEEGVLTVVLCELCYHPVSGRSLCSIPCLKICFDLFYYEPLFLFVAPNLRKDSREIKVRQLVLEMEPNSVAHWSTCRLMCLDLDTSPGFLSVVVYSCSQREVGLCCRFMAQINGVSHEASEVLSLHLYPGLLFCMKSVWIT